MCCVIPKHKIKPEAKITEMASSASPSKEMREDVNSFAVALKKKGIKLLALDFDKTLVEIHSRGFWTDDTQSLASYVRPCMKDLLIAASGKGIYTSIVTYSSQAGLIREVLHIVLPKKVASKVCVIANTPEFLARHEAFKLNGKEAHIAAVISAIEKEHKFVVKKNEVLLMDDDIDNVRKAVSSGHYAFQVQQNVNYSSFKSFETMLLL